MVAGEELIVDWIEKWRIWVAKWYGMNEWCDYIVGWGVEMWIRWLMRGSGVGFDTTATTATTEGDKKKRGTRSTVFWWGMMPTTTRTGIEATNKESLGFGNAMERQKGNIYRRDG